MSPEVPSRRPLAQRAAPGASRGMARAAVLAAVACLGAVSLFSAACTGRWAKKSADKQVYPIIAAKQEKALGEARPFTVEPTPLPLAENLMATAGTVSDEFTTTGLRFNINDALALAVTGNRVYRQRKDALYLSALTLTGVRREYSPIFAGFISADLRRDPLVGGVSRTSTLDAGVSVSQLIAATGGRITINFLTGLARAQGISANTATGLLGASIAQPLLRGAGPNVAVEPLRQAERDVIYDVREFARFERAFVIATIAEYLRMLQRLDVVENERRSYASLRQGRERSEALALAGRLDVFQVFQARQDELNSRNRWLSAQTAFAQALDTFKVRLGLPTELNIFPDPNDMIQLRDAGLKPIEVSPDTAVKLAVEQRLDYKTALDTIDDVKRRIGATENLLLPELGLTADFNVADQGQNQPLALEWRARRERLGLDFKAPLDRTRERNDYRRTLIGLGQAERDANLMRDTIALEVRSAHQNLDQARNTFDIQVASLALADRRIESAKMLLDAGRKTVRDVLESETYWINARNAVTRALVDYTLARLSYLLAVEAVDVGIEGEVIENPPDPTKIVNAGENHDAVK